METHPLFYRFMGANSEMQIHNPKYPLCNAYPNPNLPVAEFINHDDKTWNVGLVQAFFTRENCQKILQLGLPISGEYRIVWPFTKSGSFTTKSAYKLLAGELPDPNVPSYPIYKIIWSFPVIPKVQLFIWKCFENIFPSKVRLSRYAPSQDISCSMYDSGLPESAEHLILNCSYSRDVWANVPNGSIILSDAGTSISIQEWIQKWFESGRSRDFLCSIFTAAWCLWRERCFRMFQDQQLNHLHTSRMAVNLYHDSMNYLNANSSQNPHPTRTDLSPPSNSDLPHNCVLVYCDAPYDKNSNQTGIGILVTDIARSYQGCKLINGKARNPEEAESMAVFEALKWLKNKNHVSICVRNDAKNVMEYLLNNKNQTS
ncbi:uncharacterized protein LOC113331013 [Papaver somniferum]|uniref:uncharacterized protein LOC113331013 n=1 Tax=Papaver somniferum TaxID=3469 RepID=UPI000E6FDE6A|nr:uncharacterized protein LOC113331013 [Papaver somniferum]